MTTTESSTTLNIAQPTPANNETPKFPDPTPPDLILMVDIESLDLGPRPIITQIAMFGLDLGEDELLERFHYHYYPVEPQLQLATPRTFSFKTLLWWMKQGDDARGKMELSDSTDFEELRALLRHLVSTFNAITHNGTIPYEIWARGPQFDLVAIETLMTECGIETPWEYDRVRDLRTLLSLAGLNPKNVPDPAGFIKHSANWDVKAQVEHYRVAMRKLRSLK